MRQEVAALLTPSTTVVCGPIFDGERLREAHAVAFRDGVITALVPQSELPGGLDSVALKQELLMPGFVDLQVNGGGGALFNASPSVATIATIGAAHRRFGTVGFLPTLISTDTETMRRAIAAVAVAVRDGVPGVLGIHLEGPHLSPGRAGVHDVSRFREMDAEGFALATSLNAGITMLTLAPERVTPETIRRLAEAGVIVCAGHTDADYEAARQAIRAGVAGLTHLYNGMPPMLSRAPGPVGAAIDADDAWFGIVADGHHVHPAAFRMAVRAKRGGGAILVTDAMPPVGSTSESFELDGRRMRVVGGRCEAADGGLAGSSLDMITAVNNAARFAALDWFEAARMASLYPARALGLDGRLGRIRPGYSASFIAVDSERRVTRVWVDGVRYDGPAGAPVSNAPARAVESRSVTVTKGATHDRRQSTAERPPATAQGLFGASAREGT